VTISLGLASVDPERVLPLEVVIDRADQAMYLAKQQGRNRVVAWTQAERPPVI
jgi:PleD family two-component response regulator